MINIMNEYISYTEKCLMKYMKYIFEKKHNKDIVKTFIDSYIDIRYSNYIDESSLKLSLEKKIEKIFNDTEKELISILKNEKEIIQLYRKFANYFYDFDQLYLLEAQRKRIEDINKDRVELLGIDNKEFVKEFNTMLRDDIKKKKDYLDSFNSDMFSLNTYNLNGKNDILVRLSNKIKFPDLYSEKAIKKVLERDSVSEDLTSIALMQTTCLAINNMINGDFSITYYISMPGSLFDKKSKSNRIMETVDDLYIQDKISLVIDFNTFKKFKGSITEYMRKGFHFSLYLDESFEYSSDNTSFLVLFDKILLHNDKYYYKDMKKNGKIVNRIISVDEVV